MTLRLPAGLAEVHRYPGRKEHPAPNIKDAAILRVNHEIPGESLSVSYDRNRFHYTTQRTITCWPPQFTIHLSMMRHISLEYHDASFGAECFQQHAETLGEATIGCLVMQLMQHAIQLRTFSLYITAAPRCGVSRGPVLNLPDDRTLRTLRARLDKFIIVTYGPRNYLEALRIFIAPQIEWVGQDFHWHRITMHWEPYSQIFLRRSADLFRYDERVRAWHTSWLGSVGTVLWEESRRGRLWDSYQEYSR